MTQDRDKRTMHDDAPTLIGHNLVRVFGDGDSQTTALNDVSMELFKGQFALLMGPSGSGKSTLLAVLSGLLHPTSRPARSTGRTANRSWSCCGRPLTSAGRRSWSSPTTPGWSPWWTASSTWRTAS